jgi:hypothetical protein
MLTGILVDAIRAANEEAGKRPKAFDTMFRHSDAAKCGRQMALSHLEVPETEPMDDAGHWVTTLGTWIHEKWQEALLLADPKAQIEVQLRHGDLTSGHADAVMTTQEGVKILMELKTVGSFAFDKATGLMRKNWARKEPEGPRMSAIVQGSLNALACGADVLVIGLIGLEAMSKGYAEKVGASELDRFIAEWHYTRAEYEPLALMELDRLAEIKTWIDAGDLPPRWGLNDKGYLETYEPERSQFPCSYCSYRSLCIEVGPNARIADVRGEIHA